MIFKYQSHLQVRDFRGCRIGLGETQLYLPPCYHYYQHYQMCLLLYTCTTAPVLQANPQQAWLVRAKDNSFVVKLAELSLHWRKIFLVYGHKINCPEKTNSNHGADSAQYCLRTRNRFYPSTVQDNWQKIFYTTNSVLALLFFVSLIAER